MGEAEEKLRDIIYNNSGVNLSTAERIAKKIIDAGYLQVEPAHLEVLSDEELHQFYLTISDPFIPRYLDTGRQIIQATNAHNEAKGQLYRRIK